MAKIAQKLTDLIGNTPLLKLNNYIAKNKLDANIIAKIESFNPAGSVKDRVALAMVEKAEEAGLLKPGMEIIEPTSGNTGIGLAMVAATRGYKLTLTMPETMSVERQSLLKAFGAKIVLTPGEKGMQGSIDEANELAEKKGNVFIPQQFENAVNPATHEKTTAEEIWRDTEGKIDILVAGVGTGGTISGTGRRLKKYNLSVKVVAVEPADSPVLSGGKAGAHKLQGIGAGFIPKNYDAEIIDEVIAVSNDDAIMTSRQLAQEEGVLAGISAGSALFAATVLAKREENKGKNIVVILPDTGERYLSTELYAFDDYPL